MNMKKMSRKRGVRPDIMFVTSLKLFLKCILWHSKPFWIHMDLFPKCCTKTIGPNYFKLHDYILKYIGAQGFHVKLMSI